MKKIVITGSDGIMGSRLSRELENEYELVLFDKQRESDILKVPLREHFSGADIVVHLAANTDPFIDKKEADKNVEMCRRVISACENSKNLRTIINASSINVYPYTDIFDKDEKITSETPLVPNKRFGDIYFSGEYGRAKIEVEKLFTDYCKKRNLNLLNLRFGRVTPSNNPKEPGEGEYEPIDYAIHLKHADLMKVFRKGLDYKGIGNYVCVSRENGFIDESIRFPI